MQEVDDSDYIDLVPKVGLEPTRYHYQRILSFLTYAVEGVFDRKIGKIGGF